MSDAMDLLRWKNDADTRRFSIIAKDEIRQADHYKWLARTLQDPNVRLYVIFRKGKPVGDIRFDIADQVEVSVRIDRPYRRQGIGSWALSTIAPREMADIKLPFMAKIVDGNVASMRIFTKNGFKVGVRDGGVSYLFRPYERKVTAILIKHKRLEELKAIVENLKQHSFIDEILIADNSRRNIMLLARYETMHLARNDTIYIQDDDCIIQDLQDLYTKYDGTRLVNGFKAERMHLYRSKDTLVGWGTFLDRRWTYGPISKYIDMYGKDHILMRDADRIVTAMIEVPKLTVPVFVKDFPSAMVPYALSLQRDHENSKALALYRCQKIMEKEAVPV